MKRLALVTDAWHPQINGVVTTLQKMVAMAADYGWEIRVIEPSQFLTIPTPSYPEIRTAINPWKIRKLLSGVDSVHIATEGSIGLAARIVCSMRNWYFTSGFHTNFPDYIEYRTGIPAKYSVPVFRWFHSRSRAILVPSISTKTKIESWGFTNVVPWGRGVDEKIFYPRQNKTPSDKKKLLYVGRVSVEKNIEALLKLVGKYEITVVGDGPARASLEKSYPTVRFVGYKQGDELAEFYSAADVFVFPSLTDTFGIVNIEAMACGTPVAAYPVEGPKDSIIQGFGGYMHEDLELAIESAAKLSPESAVENAKPHTWSGSATTFFSNLVDLTGLKFT